MIDTRDFITGLQEAGIQFMTGVPDSLLKDVCARITSSFGPNQHIIATSEGSALGLAIGHYLATSHPALVYMQNSGLGNIVNPITSLADPMVYAIPVVLLVGWRGELLANQTQIHDEPQHVKQGRVTLEQLEILGIPFRIIDSEAKSIQKILQEAVIEAKIRSGPVALVVRKNSFSPFDLEAEEQPELLMTREEAINEIISLIPDDAAIISTTGMASRELFELRKITKGDHSRDFLTVGGMGHANQIAAGIALAHPSRTFVCIDGDGAVLMHAGGLAISADCQNLLHIVLNNEAHDSVGGQPTKGKILRFDKIAEVFGYRHVGQAASLDDLRCNVLKMLDLKGSRLLEIRCKRGSRKDLGRPDRTPNQNKLDFMKFLGVAA